MMNGKGFLVYKRSSRLPVILIGIAFLFAIIAKAERPSDQNFLQYIVHGGPVAFAQGGAAAFPVSVLSALAQGRISPIMQLVLTTHMMAEVVENVIDPKNIPELIDPYMKSLDRFHKGLCQIQKGFEQGMILGLIAQLSSNPRTGGGLSDVERQARKQQALAIATSFNGSACSEGGQAIDPVLLTILASF